MAETGDPVRQYVIDHLVEKFGTITTANGYHTNIGFKVFSEEEPAPQTVSPIPCVILDEGVELPDDESDASGGIDRGLQLIVQGVAKDDQNAPKKTARLIIADIQKMMGTAVNQHLDVPGDSGDIDLQLRITEAANLPNGGGLHSGRAYAQVNYEIVYITSKRDPHIGKPT